MSHSPAARALVVHAHPEPSSFSSSQARLAARILGEAGYCVDLLDLYAEGWAPVLDRDGFPAVDGAFKPQAEQLRAVEGGTLDVRLRAHLDRLLAADLLVLSFPLWWFSMPAILKGWIDRVFVMGGVFGGDHGLFDEAALAGRRAVLLLTTGGARESFDPGGAYGSMDDFLFHIHRGMLEFVGYRVLDPVITHAPARLAEPDRVAALDTVRESLAFIGAAP
jgi:NAD(P)H dehydrogenase (quinone)